MRILAGHRLPAKGLILPGHRLGGRTFTPAALFAASEPGVWLDPSDPATLFSDTAGTTQAGIGDPVALVLDKSGNGNHATQPTLASRPILGRVPATGRRNLLETSTDLSASNLTVTNPSLGVVRTEITNFSANQRASSFVTFDGVSSYVFSIRVFKNSQASSITLHVRQSVNSGTTFVRADIDPSTGALIGGTDDSATVIDDGDAWLVKSIPFTPDEGQWSFSIRTNNEPLGAICTYSDLQVEAGTEPTNAQIVVNQFNVTEAGVPSLRYLSFDGVNDALVTTTITPGTDKVQMFAGVRKLGEAGTFRALAEFGPNVGSNNGSFLVSAPSGSADHYRFRVSGTTLGDNLGNAGAEYAGASTDVLAVVADILTDVHSLRINGAEIESSSSGLGAGNFLEYPLNIGARNGASNFFHGHIYSLFTRFGPNLDTPTTERTERYVAKRTGVSL